MMIYNHIYIIFIFSGLFAEHVFGSHVCGYNIIMIFYFAVKLWLDI